MRAAVSSERMYLKALTLLEAFTHPLVLLLFLSLSYLQRSLRVKQRKNFQNSDVITEDLHVVMLILVCHLIIRTSIRTQRPFVSSASVLSQNSAAPDCMHTSFQDAEEDKSKGFHLFPHIRACKVYFVSVLPHRWSSLVCVLDSPRQQCANRGHLEVRLSPSAIHCCLPLDSFTPLPFCSFLVSL